MRPGIVAFANTAGLDQMALEVYRSVSLLDHFSRRC